MSHDFFDDEQLSAMCRAIDEIMEGGGLKRHEVAHAVFKVASQGGEFDATKLATMARQNLALRNNLSFTQGPDWLRGHP